MPVVNGRRRAAVYATAWVSDLWEQAAVSPEKTLVYGYGAKANRRNRTKTHKVTITQRA